MMNVINEVRRFLEEGWNIRIRKLRGRIYVSARKTENGKRVEKGIGYVSEKELVVIKELIKTKKKKTRRKPRASTTINTTTRQRLQPTSRQPPQGGVGGSGLGGGGGVGGCGFMVHRLGLRFVRPWVSPLLLQQLGRVRFVGRSKQYVLKMEVGFKRWLTVQANRDGTAQVFLEASDNPLSVEEFIGFCKFLLLEIMRRATGRRVSLGDFEVMMAPEINCDLDGVKIMEGVKSLTLEEYYSDVIRIYYSEPGVKESMPNGGTRVEVRTSSWNGRSLEEIVDGVASMARLPVVLADIKKDLDLIKGSLPRQRIEAEQLSEAVATKLANLIYLTSEKWGNRFELALRELGSKLSEALKPLFLRLQQLERENRELRRKLEELTSEDSSIRFDDLPSELKGFLRELERDGYVRLTNTRIAYGDRVWATIIRRKGNIDGWLNEESYNYMGREDNRSLFKAVIKAIRFYDNKYSGKPGVPYDKFLEALEKFMEANGDG